MLEGRDEDGISVSVACSTEKAEALKPDAALDTMRKQLSKLNDSIFALSSLSIRTRPYFLRTAELNRLRRDLTEMLEREREQAFRQTDRRPAPSKRAVYPARLLDYSYNVGNRASRKFYERHGASSMQPAFEVQQPERPVVVMTTKHCLRRCLSSCLKKGDRVLPEGPLYIENSGQRFRLEFDCRKCLMLVILD